MTIRRSTQDLDLGFGIYDSERVDQYRNSKPKVQILTPTPALPPEERTHYCSKCNKRIEWLERPRKFICYTCGLSYHELYDTPLASVDQAIHPLQGETADKPYFKSLKPNTQLQSREQDPELQITGSYRKAHIKTTNLGAVTEAHIKEYFQDEVYVR